MAATALHQLRDAIKNGDPIELDGGSIVLGSIRLEPSQPTNFHSMRGRGDAYTLNEVYTQWRYRSMAYQDYISECSRSGVQHVNPIDKRDLVAYLSGEINACAGLVAATPTTVDKQEGPEPKKRKLDGPKPITVAARRQPREQRAIDAVLMVADWDFTTIREKLGRSLENAKKSKQIITTNGPGTSGSASVGATKPATFDPRGDRYTNNPDRSWREYMGNEFQEFGINPMGSFASAPKKSQNSKAPATQNGATKSAPAPKPLPAPQQSSASRRHSERRYSESKRSTPVEPSELRPILIVPGPGTSLVNLSNVKEFFEKGHFVTEEELRKQGVAPDFSGRIKANRTPGGNCSSANYLLVSNVARLTDSEWERVVGVVCTGKTYQFKHWKWAKGNKTSSGVDVVNCLHRVQGFYFHYDDIKPDATAASWAVKLIPISRSKRYQDGYAQRQFFDAIDSFVRRHSKPVRY